MRPLCDGLKIENKEQHLYSCDNERHFWAVGVGDCSGELSKFFQFWKRFCNSKSK